MQGGTTFTFVTEGIEAALDEARVAAEDRDVYVSGGASVVQQYLEAGLLDELQINLAPVLLGGGTRLFDSGMAALAVLEIVGVVEAPAVTHLKYRVTKRR
jgi:dihydrofolate reductase